MNTVERQRRISEKYLNKAFEALSATERRIVSNIAQRVHLSRDVNDTFEDRMSLGDRVADRVAEFGGSWTFILWFLGTLVAWTVLNTVLLATDAFDPYPFIFLNLLLSMVAAIQAPVIMMSQNRQSEKDRLAAAHDYEVNLKSEIEIMSLHEKLDTLRNEQLQALIAQQEQQIVMLTRLLEAQDSRK